MLRTLTLIAVLAGVLAGEVTVYFAPNGKTYCVARNCLALSRSEIVFSAPESQAIAHGLRRAKQDAAHAATGKKATKNEWAKETK